MQSKNGGITGWEPAGAASWLEVTTLTYRFPKFLGPVDAIQTIIEQ
jgi:hypothetical protein